MTTVLAHPRCRHCGSSIILEDEDGQYCLLCRRPYHDYQEYGRMGGIQTLCRYGRDYMAEIGRRGGRPSHKTIAQLRQQPASNAQIKEREGMAAQPNNLRVLKELWKLRIQEGEALVTASVSPGKGVMKNSQSNSSRTKRNKQAR